MAGSDPIASTARETSEAKTNKTKNTTTTDPEFGPKLMENEIRICRYAPEDPTDFQEQKDAWQRARDSPEPNERQHKLFDLELSKRHTEETTLKLWCRLRQDPLERDETYGEYMNIQWTEIKNELTRGISNAKPDAVEAFARTSYPREAYEYFRELNPGQYGHVMPSFAVEYKQAMVGLPGAELQCAYDGALMVHSALLAHLRVHGNLDDFYWKTKAITIAFNGDFIEYFLHHATPNPEYRDATDYEFVFHQSLLGRHAVSGDYNDFKKAWKRVRNSQDIGYKLAKDLQTQIKAHCDALRGAPPPAVGAKTTSVPSNAPPSPVTDPSVAGEDPQSSSGKEPKRKASKDLGLEACKKAMSKAITEAAADPSKPSPTAPVDSAASRN